MSNYNQFVMRPVTSIINEFSSGGVKSAMALLPIAAGVAGYAGCKKVLSGALTASTYKELLSITGAGIIDMCGAVAEDTTSRTIGLKLVIDGVAVFDAVSSAITTAGMGIVALGICSSYSSYLMLVPQPCVFAKSLSIQVKSSLSETDMVRLGYNYQLT